MALMKRLMGLFLVASVICCQGCSVNGWGIPGFHSEVEDKSQVSGVGRKVYLTAFGFHLDTRHGVLMNVGYLESELLYPLVTSGKKHCYSYALSPGAVSSHPENLIFSDTPVRISRKKLGVGMGLSEFGMQLNVGVNHSSVLRFERNDSFSFFYSNIEGDNPPYFCAIIKQDNTRDQNEN